MASTTPITLHFSLLILLFLQLTHSAIVPNPKNHIEHKPQPSNTYIVHTNHLSKPPRFATLERWYASMVDTHSPRATNSKRILFTYDTVMHGFAVRLTDDEARRMSTAPGVSGVFKERMYYTQTTRSPGFIGLHPEFGAWPNTNFGDDVIIGVIDTGIWPESASFNDSGLGPVRPSWMGKCVDAEGFNASLCNNKLVGAKSFTDELDGDFSPRDKMGHGTHVAATAAGSEVPDANLFEFARGNASGMARRARVAMYRACFKAGCAESSIAAAIDAAVKDGVDIISMSIGGLDNPPFYGDTIAVATFGAERKGVFVVLAGGNSGPEPSTVTNVAPWMTTVGAATVDRVFPAKLKLGNGVLLTGQSLYAAKAQGTTFIRLVSSSCHADELTPDRVMGKLVVCTGRAYVQSGIDVQDAGGAGIIGLERSERLVDAVMAMAFTLPGLSLSNTGAEILMAYMASTPYPMASLSFACDTVTGENRAPMVVAFSSRGPSTIVPEILKPDVVAPGVNILAAWPADVSLSDPTMDPRRVDYKILSGTSMACPHVAGLAALIKGKHRDWTSAMVRSALMTTATALDKDGRDILDNGVGDGDTSGRKRNVTKATPLVAGAGLVRPRLAMDPGLVYDVGTQDYVDFLCTLNYTTEQLRLFVPDLAKCTRTIPGGVANLNYPSLVVVFDGHTHVRTLTRTVTKVSVKPEKYTATVVTPDGVKVTVTPPVLEFKQQNEKKTYTVEFRSEAGGKVKPAAGGWDFGHITWENRRHQVRSPIAFTWEN